MRRLRHGRWRVHLSHADQSQFGAEFARIARVSRLLGAISLSVFNLSLAFVRLVPPKPKALSFTRKAHWNRICTSDVRPSPAAFGFCMPQCNRRIGPHGRVIRCRDTGLDSLVGHLASKPSVRMLPTQGESPRGGPEGDGVRTGMVSPEE